MSSDHRAIVSKSLARSSNKIGDLLGSETVLEPTGKSRRRPSTFFHPARRNGSLSVCGKVDEKNTDDPNDRLTAVRSLLSLPQSGNAHYANWSRATLL